MNKLIFALAMITSLPASALASSAVITHAHSAYTVQVTGIDGCTRVYEGTVIVDNYAAAWMRCYNGDGYLIAIGSCNMNFTGSEADCTVFEVDSKYNRKPHYTFTWKRQ